MQSKRDYLPRLYQLQTMEAFLTDVENHNFDEKILFWEEEDVKNNIESIPCGNKKSICIVVGPEGGMSQEEVTSFMKKGFKSISLGKTILRVEIAAVSMIKTLQMRFR